MPFLSDSRLAITDLAGGGFDFAGCGAGRTDGAFALAGGALGVAAGPDPDLGAEADLDICCVSPD